MPPQKSLLLPKEKCHSSQGRELKRVLKTIYQITIKKWKSTS